MKGRQQGYRNILVEFLLMAGGALTAFAEIPVGEHIKVMVAHPATQNGFVQIVVKPDRRLIVPAESFAFQVHNPFLDLFFLGPCLGCGKDGDNDQNQNELQIL